MNFALSGNSAVVSVRAASPFQVQAISIRRELDGNVFNCGAPRCMLEATAFDGGRPVDRRAV